MKLAIVVVLLLLSSGCSWIGNTVERHDAKRVNKAVVEEQRCLDAGKSEYCANKDSQ